VSTSRLACSEHEPARVLRARTGSRAQSTNRLVRAATYIFVRHRAKKRHRRSISLDRFSRAISCLRPAAPKTLAEPWNEAVLAVCGPSVEALSPFGRMGLKTR